MRQQKLHKKDLKPRRKNEVEETFYHGRPTDQKVKYRHKSFWLEEDQAEIIPLRKPKKVKH